jgi:hypothetical protein
MEVRPRTPNRLDAVARRSKGSRRWRAGVRVAFGVAFGALVTGSLAHADPTSTTAASAPRLVDRQSAQLHGAYLMAGINHHGDWALDSELRLGDIAAVGIGNDDRLLVGATAKDATIVTRPIMRFRLGIDAHRWGRYQPALDLTFERTYGKEGVGVAELRTSATERWQSDAAGTLEATFGVGLWDLGGGASARLSRGAASARIRPFLGLVWTPPSYPRTRLLLEGSFGPSLVAEQPRLDWRLGWGARYQVFDWIAIDLVVRNRQDAGLAGSTVMVRGSAQFE